MAKTKQVNETLIVEKIGVLTGAKAVANALVGKSVGKVLFEGIATLIGVKDVTVNDVSLQKLTFRANGNLLTVTNSEAWAGYGLDSQENEELMSFVVGNKYTIKVLSVTTKDVYYSKANSAICRYANDSDMLVSCYNATNSDIEEQKVFSNTVQKLAAMKYFADANGMRFNSLETINIG